MVVGVGVLQMVLVCCNDRRFCDSLQDFAPDDEEAEEAVVYVAAVVGVGILCAAPGHMLLVLDWVQLSLGTWYVA